MIYYKIYFQPYDWDIEIYILFEEYDINMILESLKGCPESEIQRAFLNITTRVNSGFIKTFNKRSIIVINQPITLEDFINVYNHEKNHLEMHICEEFNIDPYSEEAAELSGNLAKCLFISLMNKLVIYYSNVNKY
jgi:hypothetical protein